MSLIDYDWETAYKHLQEVRHRYVDIGEAGILGLLITLNPLVSRYQRGERTEKLYDEMMAVK